MMGQTTFMSADSSTDDRTWALIDFAAWCYQSKGNLKENFFREIRCSVFLRRREAQVEREATSPLIKCALRGIARSHVVQGTRHRVRLPWRMLLEGEYLVPARGVGGEVLWLCMSLSYFFIARSDEMFASSLGRVHPARCLTRRYGVFPGRHPVGVQTLAASRLHGGEL